MRLNELHFKTKADLCSGEEHGISLSKARLAMFLLVLRNAIFLSKSYECEVWRPKRVVYNPYLAQPSLHPCRTNLEINLISITSHRPTNWCCRHQHMLLRLVAVAAAVARVDGEGLNAAVATRSKH